jgi:nitrogen regulatory protein PII 2
MKKIIAIIRNERANQTKALLKFMGMQYIMDFPVRGRGEKKDFALVPDILGTFRRDAGIRLLQYRRLVPNTDKSGLQVEVKKESVSCFVPKRMLIIFAKDGDASLVVNTIISINKSGRPGDGKIFICPIARAIDIENIDFE